MEFIEWDGSLALGVPEIDDDHEELVNCYNRLFESVYSSKARSVVIAELKTLVNHTWSHFHCEEALMESVGYPELMSHKAAHELLLSAVLLLQNRLSSDPNQPIIGHRFSFLRSWMLNHMMEADRDLAEYILKLRAIDHIYRPPDSQNLEAA